MEKTFIYMGAMTASILCLGFIYFIFNCIKYLIKKIFKRCKHKFYFEDYGYMGDITNESVFYFKCRKCGYCKSIYCENIEPEWEIKYLKRQELK